jgi:predicted DNA-binding transcriptional regulator AlpA
VTTKTTETAKAAKFLTLEEACQEIGVSRSTMDKWRATGRCPAFRKLPNGSLRVSADVFAAWLAELPVAA